MGFRLVRSAGSVTEPAIVTMYGSGVIHKDGVVIYDASLNEVSPASSASTTTNIFGVSQDYIQGNSDSQVRVIPFVQGQLWEADCANTIATVQLLVRHQLVDDLTLRNVTGGTAGGTSESASTGVFLSYQITGLTTGSGKIIGTFLQRTPTRGDGFAVV